MTVCDILEILPLVFSWAFYFLLPAAAPGFKFTFILGKIVNKNVDMEFNPGYLVGSVLLIHVVFCVVLLCVFTLRVPSCDFRIKTKFGSFWPPVVCGTAHVWVICVCLCVVVSNVFLGNINFRNKTETGYA
jgi:hypothetical protein